jgi:hypothetical protein
MLQSRNALAIRRRIFLPDREEEQRGQGDRRAAVGTIANARVLGARAAGPPLAVLRARGA